ncbi:hypothetical protein DQ04_04721060 [Trypanosoma grayi]|uniref:hypothetical protein n=1 Tax=Trypanosoma grayi TaxID=71804 RepID=UPI0004F419D1|nr:hypothetical protein DQ04_04721060 [Trypanosoma grayi]KEG09745.1 hypothetical protein DQ04_04721060 [Trypanosoma grayi]
MREYGATVREHEAPTARYEFIRVCFNHIAKKGFFSDKTLQKLKSPTPLQKISVEELKRPTWRMVCAAGVQGGSLLRYYFFLKTAHRRQPRLNRGLLQAQGSGSFTPLCPHGRAGIAECFIAGWPCKPPRANRLRVR